MKTINLNTDQRGSIAYLYAIPTSSFVRINHDYHTGLESLVLRQIQDIIQIPISDGCEWEESDKIAAGGIVFQPKITGKLNPAATNVPNIIYELIRGNWLVLHIDAIGTARLSGSVNVPMRFNTQSKSGQHLHDANQVQFSLSGLQPSPSKVVSVSFHEL